MSPRSDKAVALLKSQQLGLPAQSVHKSEPVNIPACSGGGPKTPPLTVDGCWKECRLLKASYASMDGSSNTGHNNGPQWVGKVWGKI